jgi:hypothetical protein
MGTHMISVTTQSELDAARGPDVDLLVDGPDANFTLDVARNVRVFACGSLDATAAKIGSHLVACGAKIGGDLIVEGATIGGHFSVRRATISGNLNAVGATVGADLSVDEAAIFGDLNIAGTKIGGYVIAYNATINGGINMRGATIGRDLRFEEAAVDGGVTADGATIGGTAIGKITPEEVAILDAIPRNRCDMRGWHGNVSWINRTPQQERGCGTTHCLAGWAQTLSSDPEIRCMGPLRAGQLLLPNVSYLFFAPQQFVDRWLRDREYAQS